MSKILENQPARNPSPAWVGQYIAAGLDLIPLRNWNAVRYDAERKADVKVGKAPLLKDWRGVVSMAPENAEHHMRNGGNIGVRLGHDWIVLDFDKRNLPEADRANPSAALKRFADAFGIDLKRYPLVRTGNGVHIYMRKPSDLTVAGVVRDWPGFDVKKHGGYVVAAGSMHPDTGAMYVHDERTPTFADAPEAPPRFLDHLKVKPPSGASAEPGEGHFGAHDVDRIAAMLAGLDPVQFGRGRHGDWFGVMCSTHFLSGGAAEDAFVAWCRRDPAYDSDDHESSVRARWNSLHTEGASATNRFGLYRELRHAGRDDLVPAPVVSDETDAEADAAALAQTAVKAKSTADIVKALGGWSAVADTILRRRFTRGGVVTLV
ncbi:MAG: bifunctional DNA primase/polymerase, partial [Hyphomonadaceae bacterium]|nr:bifunctional DNA primase/polymerase [Hyphomonadaceae bacterium]